MIQAEIADATIWSVEDLQMMIRLAECLVLMLLPLVVLMCTGLHLLTLEGLIFVSSRLKVVFMLVLNRDLLTSEGLIDLLSNTSGQQTGRCVSLAHPLKMATDFEIIVQAIISLLCLIGKC